MFVNVASGSINIGPDQTLCSGDSFIFNNVFSGTCLWSPNYAINDIHIKNPTVRPTVSTTYYLEVTIGTCILRDTIHFDVIQVSAHAGADLQICIGDSVQLHGSFIGNSFSWSPVAGLSNPTILDPFARPLSSSYFILTAINGTCTAKDSVLVSASSSVTANAGRDTSICAGQKIALFASGGNNYLWLNPYHLNNPGIFNPIVSPTVDTFYVVKVGIGQSCFGIDTVAVKVNPSPTVNAGPDLLHCFGDSMQLTATVAGANLYFWYPDSCLTNSLILNPKVSVKHSMQYILVAQNGACANTDTVEVRVMPKVSADFDMSSAIAISPASIHFTSKSNNAFFFRWTFGETAAESNDINPDYTYKNEGEFIVWLIKLQ